ncbi:hypothetical protein B0H13DRAFT_1856171 [Mycena leptocephala]|nr:hypothetical protein B0H13DRAFT_1856171 [Mycena leptocephala]
MTFVVQIAVHPVGRMWGVAAARISISIDLGMYLPALSLTPSVDTVVKVIGREFNVSRTGFTAMPCHEPTYPSEQCHWLMRSARPTNMGPMIPRYSIRPAGNLNPGLYRSLTRLLGNHCNGVLENVPEISSKKKPILLVSDPKLSGPLWDTTGRPPTRRVNESERTRFLTYNALKLLCPSSRDIEMVQYDGKVFIPGPGLGSTPNRIRDTTYATLQFNNFTM